MLTDLQEQLWAKTRSDQCLPEIKSIFTNVSRPYSALNRLGSFINWPFSRHAKSASFKGKNCSILDLSPFKLCDNGLFLKANDQLSMYDNDRIELNCLSPEASLSGSQKSQIEFIG